MTASPGDGLLRLLKVFDRLEIPYMIGGSSASSVHGLDADNWRRRYRSQCRRKCSGTGCRASGGILHRRAAGSCCPWESSRSFNVIHYRSSYKFDIFPLTGDRYQQVQFGRRRYETSSVFTGEPLELAVSSPEDVILSKLRWFRQGGEVSEQQWNDVLGVIAAQRERLDLPYLGEWAQYLGVAELIGASAGRGESRRRH